MPCGQGPTQWSEEVHSSNVRGESEYLLNSDASMHLQNIFQVHPLPYTAIAPTLVQVSWLDVHTAFQLVSLPPVAPPICSPHRSQRDPLTGLIISCSLSNGFPLHWGKSRIPYPKPYVLQKLSPDSVSSPAIFSLGYTEPHSVPSFISSTFCPHSCCRLPFLSTLPLLTPSHSRCHSLYLELACLHSPCYLGFLLFTLKISARPDVKGSPSLNGLLMPVS